MLRPIYLYKLAILSFKLLYLMLKVRVRVRNAVGKIDKLILHLKLILKSKGVKPIEILSILFVDITKLMSLRKLKGLSRLYPLLCRGGIGINLHSDLIRQLTPRKIDDIEFSPLVDEILDSKEKPACMSLGIAVHSQEKIIHVVAQ